MTSATGIHVQPAGPGIPCQFHRCNAEAKECADVRYSDGWEEGNYLCPPHTDALIVRHGGNPAALDFGGVA